MPEPPLVTVLMSVFNDAEFLREAIQSVLDQTLADFEFLIIDDGSSEATAALLKGFRDPRIRLAVNERNLGLTRSLRRGMELARGKYVARMDGDDVCLPRRLEKQAAFLEGAGGRGSGVVLLGSACWVIDERGRRRHQLDKPASDLEIRWRSMFGNPFLHSAVMLRRDFFERHGLRYDEGFETAQDYDLWARALALGKGANLKAPLILYRERAGVTRKRRKQQLENSYRTAMERIRMELPAFQMDAGRLEQLRTLFLPADGQPENFLKWSMTSPLGPELFAAFKEKHGKDPDWARVRRAWGVDRMRAFVGAKRFWDCFKTPWELGDLGVAGSFAGRLGAVCWRRSRIWRRNRAIR